MRGDSEVEVDGEGEESFSRMARRTRLRIRGVEVFFHWMKTILAFYDYEYWDKGRRCYKSKRGRGCRLLTYFVD